MADNRIIPKGVKIALAAPGAATAIFGGLVPVLYASTFRVTVRLATGSIFNATVTPTGGSKITMALNGGVALSAGNVYTFDLPVRKHNGAATPVSNSYDFEIATDGVVSYLQVDELETA